MLLSFLFSPCHVWLFETPWTAAHHASLSFTIPQSLLTFMSIELVISSNHLILCHPFTCPQSFPASRSFPMSQFFTSGGQSIRASALASVLPVNIQNWFHLGLTGLIDFLVAQGTLKSLLQHHSSKTSILQHSAFFMVQLPQLYMTDGKNHSFDYVDLCWQSGISAF